MDVANPTDADVLQRLAAVIADRLSDVLGTGELDAHSRAALSDLYRTLSSVSAIGSNIDCKQQPAPGNDFDSYREHPGSFWAIWPELPCGTRNRISRAGLVWLDEIDGLDDRDLHARGGIGPKTITALRALLEDYYWRRDAGASRALWERILQRLCDGLGYRWLKAPDRSRLLAGISFAHLVIDTSGRPLADPAAIRKVVP